MIMLMQSKLTLILMQSNRIKAAMIKLFHATLVQANSVTSALLACIFRSSCKFCSYLRSRPFMVATQHIAGRLSGRSDTGKGITEKINPYHFFEERIFI